MVNPQADFSAQNTQDGQKKNKQGLKEEADNFKEQSKNTIDEMSGEVKKRATQMGDALESYVKENPLLALGWAALAGAGIALLLRR